MNKEEIISHWMLIASTIFRAEDEIKDVWFPKLRAAKTLPPDEKQKLADDYLRAIATEIITHSVPSLTGDSIPD